MPSAELIAIGAHTMTVCNACRYCEQYCPVFQAMERRQTFDADDLALLSNLCHNCGECLYACQYAPPHEFGIDVPRTMARLRKESYADFCWPRFMGRAYDRQGPGTALVLTAACVAAVFAVALAMNPGALAPRTDAAFYAVLSHDGMVWLFGGVGLYVVLALSIAMRRCWHAVSRGDTRTPPRVVAGALRDAVTLKHLHVSGQDCVSAEETRTPWRRWWHHATLGGFTLCLASTTVAACYHSLMGWEAPYGFTSAPVVLGTAGGVGLTIGPLGQWWDRRRRDPRLADPAQRGLDDGFVLLLWLTSVTGLLLLVLRERPAMAFLLLSHLGIVLALLLTLPYGKFVHGLYRTLALVRDAVEARGASH